MDSNFIEIEGDPNPHAPRAPGLRCGALFECLHHYAAAALCTGTHSCLRNAMTVSIIVALAPCNAIPTALITCKLCILPCITCGTCSPKLLTRACSATSSFRRAGGRQTFTQLSHSSGSTKQLMMAFAAAAYCKSAPRSGSADNGAALRATFREP